MSSVLVSMYRFKGSGSSSQTTGDPQRDSWTAGALLNDDLECDDTSAETGVGRNPDAAAAAAQAMIFFVEEEEVVPVDIQVDWVQLFILALFYLTNQVLYKKWIIRLSTSDKC